MFGRCATDWLTMTRRIVARALVSACWKSSCSHGLLQVLKNYSENWYPKGTLSIQKILQFRYSKSIIGFPKIAS